MLETITFKLEDTMLHNIDSTLRRHNFSTRTEFIRDAIREKLEELKDEELMQQFLKLRGSAKKNVSDEDFEKVRSMAWDKLAKDRGWT